MSRSRSFKVAVMVLTVGTGLALAACNTVSGAGNDMESAGEAVTNTANEAK